MLSKKSELDQIDNRVLHTEPDQARKNFDEIKEAEIEDESITSSEYSVSKLGKTIQIDK
jgi:hypothetical protein